MLNKRNRYLILVLLFLGWCLGSIDRYIMNYAVVAITEDLNLTSSTTGIILSSFFLGYAIMQIPGGWLADRFGARKVLLFSVISWSIFTGFTGAAWSLASMVMVRFLFGIGEGGFQPSSSKIISQSFPIEERGRAMSIMLSSGGIMTLIVPLLSAVLLTTIGWRITFVIFGILGLVIAIFYWRYVKLPDEEEAGQDDTTETPFPKGQLRNLLKTPMIWNLVIAYFCIYAVNWGLFTWIPTYLVTVRDLDLISLGWVQTIPGLAMLIGILLSGYIVDKLGNRWDRIAGAISSACIAILIYLMVNATTVTIFIAYQTIVNLFISLVIVLLPAIILKQLPSKVTGTAMGIANTGGQLAGFITPMVIGFTVDAFNGSFQVAFLILAGFAIICIVSLLTLNDKKGALL